MSDIEVESVKDKVARLDHDSIVRIETVVNNMAADLKTLADGFALRLTTLETRTTALEKINDEIKPNNLAIAVVDHDREIRDFKTTLRNFNWLFGGSFLGFMAMVTYLTRFFGLLK